MLWQTRWMYFFAAASLGLAVVVVAILGRQQFQRGRPAAWFVVLAAAAGVLLKQWEAHQSC